MKFLANLALLASLASAASMGKRSQPLDIQIEQVGNSVVKATITNTGAEDLRLLKTGGLLDSAPVEKVKVFQGNNKLDFEGIRLRLMNGAFADEAFQTIPAGQTIEISFDAAELHDLTTTGDYDFVASGVLSFATTDRNEVAGVIPYSSNTITAKVDGEEAAKVRSAFVKRTSVQSDCTGSKLTATRNAVTNCRSFASRASSAALSNTAKVQEYFKSTSVGSTVASVFARVVSECGSTSSGSSRTYCSDIYGACSSNVLAYTLPSNSYIVNCPLCALPATTGTCHAQDQATTTLHEVTHLNSVAGTDDLGYGYAAATRLSSSQALNNADSYALFANAIAVGC
ncbi:neutral protease 2-like protein [Xylaria bambusicola]|uniref:neutral protease 2-like protein n=1 Tax=Xylaria bambusicola TaxID=326684 RepID=UPI002007ACC2|nr:neutral protease 2-like protein [Xylaria bambusicola]KAI0506078.1 neutral protease 2-like protein [Xylaria bambusicola]